MGVCFTNLTNVNVRAVLRKYSLGGLNSCGKEMYKLPSLEEGVSKVLFVSLTAVWYRS